MGRGKHEYKIEERKNCPIKIFVSTHRKIKRKILDTDNSNMNKYIRGLIKEDLIRRGLLNYNEDI